MGAAAVTQIAIPVIGLSGASTSIGLGDIIALKRLFDKLKDAASKFDRNGLTSAGRAYQKHMNRPGSAYPQVPQNPNSLNSTGQQVVDEILTNPGSTVRTNRLGGVDVKAPDGRGIRYNQDGSFRGFLEPNK
jgi:hypothetical protein